QHHAEQIAANRIRDIEQHHAKEKRAEQRARRKGCNPREAKRDRERRGDVQIVRHCAALVENSVWLKFETCRWPCSSRNLYLHTRIAALPERVWVARMTTAAKSVRRDETPGVRHGEGPEGLRLRHCRSGFCGMHAGQPADRGSRRARSRPGGGRLGPEP